MANNQQFVVPQFIDVEDKIFGPISVRQFLILLAAGILIFIFYKLFTMVLFIILTVITGGTAIVFAFVKIKGQDFHYFILNLFQYTRKDRLRVWDKRYTKDELNFLRQREEHKQQEVQEKKKAKKKRIRDLSLVVNTGGYYEGKKDFEDTSDNSFAEDLNKEPEDTNKFSN